MIKNLFRRKVKLQNSRRFKRIHAAYLVKYQVNGKGKPCIANVLDISAGGIRFWTVDPVPEKAVLHISILLPGLDHAIKALGKVIRIRKAKKGFLSYSSVAVSFLDLKQEDRQAISDFAEIVSRDNNTQFMIDHADVVVRKR
jgi:c-di-GMP-binding flagellar brake protein YcgR